jgi:hypothetical protein
MLWSDILIQQEGFQFNPCHYRKPGYIRRLGFIPQLTDKAIEKYNAYVYMPLYLSVPRDIKIYLSVMSN